MHCIKNFTKEYMENSVNHFEANMRKKNFASSSTPDVTHDIDEDGTKVIIRRFDMPLPYKNPQKVLERKFEKWKYQHDVPEGKIFTKRVHSELNSVSGPSKEIAIAPKLPNALVPIVLPTNTPSAGSVQVAKAPARKDVIVLAPNEQLQKLASVPKNLCPEKITLNNLPENVIANSIQVVDSRYVNGKKVFYLKAFKDAGKVVSQSVKSGTEVLLKPSEDNNQMVNCIPGNGSSECSITEVKCVYPGRTLQNIPESKPNDECSITEVKRVYPGRTLRAISEIRQNDRQVGTPISKIRSALAQKLNVTSHQVPIGNEFVKHCNNGLTKEFQVNKPISVVVSGSVPQSNVYVSSLPPQSNREPKNQNIYLAEPLSRIKSGVLECSSVTRDVVTNSGREITLQINPTSKPDTRILIDSSKQNISVAESNISVLGLEFPSSAFQSVSTVNDSILNVDDQSVIQEGKMTFVPADSTTPYLINSSSTSVNQNVGNCSAESVLVMSHEDMNKNQQNSVANVNQKQSGSNCTEPNIISRGANHSPIQNIVILNPNQNSANPPVTMIPKQNLKVDELLRRRKIALQFQRDMHKDKDMPRIERTLNLPARKVNIVDSSTQTSLFCMLEPGRMVEMYVNEDSVDRSTIKPAGSRGSPSDLGIMKEWNQVGGEKTAEMTHNATTAQFKLTTNGQIPTNETMDPPLSKRIRLDLNNAESYIQKESIEACHNTVMENSLLSSSMDFQDLIEPHFEGMDKENIESTNARISSKHYECDFQNININYNNNSVPFASMQFNDAFNCDERNNDLNNRWKNEAVKLASNKKIWERLIKDYRSSLVPDEDGNLPIHNAVMDKNVIEVLRQSLVLTALKKSVDMKNGMKETPLHLAVLCHDIQIVSLLLKHQAGPDIPDSEGNTAVHMAIIWGNNIDILKALLESVGDNAQVLNSPNDEGYSPLHLCALHNKRYEAYLLVKKNVEINIRDRKSGRTPLFLAVENGDMEMSQMLIKYGASTTIANFSGQTPLNASEVTFVLDRLAKNLELQKTPKSLIAPCLCQNGTEAGRKSCNSHSKNISGFDSANADGCSNNELCADFDLMDRVFSDR